MRGPRGARHTTRPQAVRIPPITARGRVSPPPEAPPVAAASPPRAARATNHRSKMNPGKFTQMDEEVDAEVDAEEEAAADDVMAAIMQHQRQRKAEEDSGAAAAAARVEVKEEVDDSYEQAEEAEEAGEEEDEEEDEEEEGQRREQHTQATGSRNEGRAEDNTGAQAPRLRRTRLPTGGYAVVAQNNDDDDYEEKEEMEKEVEEEEEEEEEEWEGDDEEVLEEEEEGEGGEEEVVEVEEAEEAEDEEEVEEEEEEEDNGAGRGGTAVGETNAQRTSQVVGVTWVPGHNRWTAFKQQAGAFTRPLLKLKLSRFDTETERTHTIYPQRVLTSSRKVDECKPQAGGGRPEIPWVPPHRGGCGRDIHSSTSQLNLSRLGHQKYTLNTPCTRHRQSLTPPKYPFKHPRSHKRCLR